MRTSTVPSDAHELSRSRRRHLRPGFPAGRSSAVAAVPSASARSASRTTAGSEHAPPTQPTSVPSWRMSARSPRLAEAGRRTETTVARTNSSPASASRPASIRTSARVAHSASPASASACQTLSDVSGMSMFRTPACQSASMTAFTYAAGDPTVADSPTPFAPIGWCGEGVASSPRSNSGVSQAVGMR